MPQYLISFDYGAMTFPEEDFAAVGAAAHRVIQEAMDSGVWVFCGGVNEPAKMDVVATDGTVVTGPYPEKQHYMGGLTVVDVASREEALEWGAKIAAACRCAQEVREFQPDASVYRAPATHSDAT